MSDRIDSHIPRGCFIGCSRARETQLNLIERRRDLLTRRAFFRRSHAIFDVEHNGVHVQAQSLFNHARAVSGHKHPGTE